MNSLRTKIDTKTAKIGIIGLGYVGLPLAVEFAKAGFTVAGFDLDQTKIDTLNAAKSYIPDVSGADIRHVVRQGLLFGTTNFELLADMDVVTICVPTPLKKTKDPDMSYIVAAAETLAKYMHGGMLVTLESTTYPGTTEEILLPLLSGAGENGLVVGADFCLCFSPERVDPGNPTYQTRNIPKVVGGVTAQCTELGVTLYRHAVDTVVPVKGTVTAEMVKLLENTFRMINIGLVNELAIMCDRMGINIWDVIDAAKTKPFGFMPFYPGPGLGGHCIPIDPFYLSWKSKQYGCDPRFIELAGVINAQMPHYVVGKVQDILNNQEKSIKGSNIFIFGMAYKKDIDDVRESPALDIAHLLLDKGAKIKFYDSNVPSVRVNGTVLENYDADNTEILDVMAMRMGLLPVTEATARIAKFEAELQGSDCVIIATDHSSVDYAWILANSKAVLDTRNAMKGLESPRIVRL